MSARDRISAIVQKWFLVEPLFLSVWTAHALEVNPRIRSIRVHHGRIEYDPRFIDSLSRRQLEEVLQVEAMRIVLKHPYSRRREIAELSYAASNLTLQEYLRTSLPLPRARDVFGHHELDRQYFEFYYHKLIEQSSPAAAGIAGAGAGDGLEVGVPGVPAAGGGEEDGTADDGGGPAAEEEAAAEEEKADSGLAAWADPAATGRENAADWDADELFVDAIDDHIRTAAENNTWGTVAGRFRERILAGLKPKLNYRALLRQFRASIVSIERRLTRMKPNRRYGFQYMGSRYDFTTRLLFAVDVSGSMGTEDLRRGFSVINQLFKYGVPSIDVVQFDTELKGPPVAWRKARRETVAFGRGGTSFGPVIDFLDHNRQYDGAIVFTDGYAPVPRAPANRWTRLFWLFNTESSYQQMEGLRALGRAAFLKED